MSDLDQNSSHPYDALTPDTVINAVESTGLLSDMRQLALNSYENRVYQIGIEPEGDENAEPVIVKFYRPNRWSTKAIQEEHDFLLQLEEDEVPVIAPITIDNKTLFEFSHNQQTFEFTIFPRRNGHAPEFSDLSQLEQLGRWLARIHQVGLDEKFQHREMLQGQDLITNYSQQVISSGLIPEDYLAAYQSICDELNQLVNTQYQAQPEQLQRVHGDFHAGNILWRDEQIFIVDFDDCMQGPVMQDIWMLLSGSREEQLQQLSAIRDGYQMFRPFPNHQLAWIESLRTLRLVKYTAWLCQRWADPAFKMAFPWFTGHQYWSSHILSLREQISALQEPALFLYD